MSANDRGTEKRIVASADSRTLKRAQYEAFEFELVEPGRVRVINGSHAQPDEHTYDVTVRDGVPVRCECKADQYGDGPCKHRVGVAIREPIMQVAQASRAQPAVADGGQTMECPNGESGCCGPDGDDLPCFNCYREMDR